MTHSHNQLLDHLNNARQALLAEPPAQRNEAAARALARIANGLSHPPRIAILGEFNSGKSSLVNLILGYDELPDGLEHVRGSVTLLYYSDKITVHSRGSDARRRRLTTAALARLETPPDHVEIGLPCEPLRHFSLLEAPSRGANAHEHGRSPIPAPYFADACIWCTLAPQAWKRSEQTAWQGLPERRRARALLIATHADALPSEADRARVGERLADETGGRFREIVLVSIPQAQQARTPNGPDSAAQWRKSGAAKLGEVLGELTSSAWRARQAVASAAARTIAVRMLAQTVDLGATDATRLIDMWNALRQSLVSDMAGSTPDQQIARIAAHTRSFCLDTLEPWLLRTDKTSQPTATKVLALMPTDAQILHTLIDLPSDKTADDRLALVLAQVEEELNETLPLICSLPPPADPLSAESKEALERLAQWPKE